MRLYDGRAIQDRESEKERSKRLSNQCYDGPNKRSGLDRRNGENRRSGLDRRGDRFYVVTPERRRGMDQFVELF